MLTVAAQKATTLDHLKPKSRGGSSLRSNLIPACQCCNHSKGSENWLEWFQRQEFYNNVAQEAIEDWISNKRFIEEELDERRTDNRTTLCPLPSTLRSSEDEPPSFREDGLAIALSPAWSRRTECNGRFNKGASYLRLKSCSKACLRSLVKRHLLSYLK